MKKNLLIVAFLGLATSSIAQEASEDKYVRNSIYMLKLDMPASDSEYAHAFDVMNATFDGIDFAKRYERYNDFSLANRHIVWNDTPTATEEELNAIDKPSKVDELVKQQLTEMGIKQDPIEAREYVARILKYLNQKNMAKQLVAKWHIAPNANPENVEQFDNNLEVISDLGLKGLSAEAKAEAQKSENLRNACANSEQKLLSTTYVCVNNYRIQTAEEKTAPYITGLKVAASFLPGIAQTGAQIAIKAAELVAQNTKGYFVNTRAYLFKLNWDEAIQNNFYEKYWDNPADFNANANYSFTYVGKSSKYAGAGMTMKSANVDKLTARGCLRATDAAFAALQRDYEEFRPMSSLHVSEDGSKLIVYIGKKEDVKEGDKFEVLQAVEGKDGQIEWKKVSTIKVAKKGVWDNREGANEQIEGAAVDGDDEAAESLSYTIFDAKPSKKLGEGLMIRMTGKSK